MVRTFNGHYGFLSACCLSAGWRSGLVTSGKPANFLAMCIFIFARKRWPPASAHILTTATGLPALIAGTVTSWRRAEIRALWRSEEHTSELQSLMRNSYAVFCLNKQTQRNHAPLTSNTGTITTVAVHARFKDSDEAPEDLIITLHNTH